MPASGFENSLPCDKCSMARASDHCRSLASTWQVIYPQAGRGPKFVELSP